MVPKPTNGEQNITPLPASGRFIEKTPNINDNTFNNFNGINIMYRMNSQIQHYNSNPTHQYNNRLLNGFSLQYPSISAHAVVNIPNLLSHQNNQMTAGPYYDHQCIPRHVPRPSDNSKISCSVKKQKRIRTAFTTQQMTIFEEDE